MQREEIERIQRWCAVLGVSAQASKEEIKKAYRAKTLQWHPDKNSNSPESQQKIKEINEAYEGLKDLDLSTLRITPPPPPRAAPPASSPPPFIDGFSFLKDWIWENNLQAIKAAYWRPYTYYNHEELLALRDSILLSITHNKVAILSFLVERYPYLADSFFYFSPLQMSIPFIFYAAYCDFGESVRILNKANNLYISYALAGAVMAGKLGMVNLCLSLGASINASFEGRTILAYAAQAESKDMVLYFIRMGAHVVPAIESAFEYMHSKRSELLEELRDFTAERRNGLIANILGFSRYHQDLALAFNGCFEKTMLNTMELEELIYRVDRFLQNYFVRTDCRQLVMKILSHLQKFDNEKIKKLNQIIEIEKNYKRIIKTLMDYCTGVNFTHPKAKEFFVGDLQDVNLIGVKVNFLPITGVRNALMEPRDLDRLFDYDRKQILKNRVVTWQRKQNSFFESRPARPSSKPNFESGWSCKIM